jgi:hypothetical protein
MPRKNSFGKDIFAAGEISTYAFCPEAWRISYLHQAKTPETKSVEEGRIEHKTWSNQLEISEFLKHGSIVILIAIGAAIITYLAL